MTVRQEIICTTLIQAVRMNMQVMRNVQTASTAVGTSIIATTANVMRIIRNIKLQAAISYIAVAVLCFFAGMPLCPSGANMRKARSALSYTRHTAQRLYDGWDKDALCFADGTALASFETAHDTYLVYFWATWCPHCANVADSIETLSSAAVPLVALPFDTDRDAYEAYRSEHPHFWQDLLLKDSSGERVFCPRTGAYNIPSIPSVWLVRNGRIEKRFRGEKGIAALLPYLRQRQLL